MPARITEDDFAALKKPLESGRQSPSSIGANLLLSVFGQGLFFFLEYYIAKFTEFPNHEAILEVHFWWTLILVVLSLLYSIPSIYMNSQKIQYLLSILVIQNIGAVSIYILILFMMGTEEALIQSDSLNSFVWITLLLGLLIFIATSIRFYLLLSKGMYRKGSTKDRVRSKFETKSYVPLAIIGGIALFFVAQFLFRLLGTPDIDMTIMLTLMTVIFYAMLFILPEQLVILFCKHRFKAFNFSKDGILSDNSDIA